MTRPRGFTLLEMTIGIALSVIVVGTVTTTLASVLRQEQRQRVHAELQRDAEFLGQLLVQELRQAGLGVPRGAHVQRNPATTNRLYGTGSNATTNNLLFAARRVLVAGATEIGILGDLPRPDSNYNVFGPLHSRFTGTGTALTARESIAWHNENNGTCVPQLNDCSTATASMFFPGTAAACTNAGTELTCPWSLRRLGIGDRLQIVDGRGNWSHTARGSAPIAYYDSPHNFVLSMHVNPTFDVNGNVWQNNATGAGPSGFIGQSYVTTLDRVFFKLETVAGKQVIHRTQCFGDPDPGDAANWPSGTNNAVPANPASVNPPTSGGVTAAANVCIGPEVVARNIKSVAFSYFDASGNVVNVATDADKELIARAEWTVVFENNVNVSATPVTYTLQGAVVFHNI